MLAVAVAFGVIIEEVFGGTNEYLNPALTIEHFYFRISNMDEWRQYGYMGLLSVLVLLMLSQVKLYSSYAQSQDIVYGYADMFFGCIPGSIETSKILIILGGLFLIFTKVGSCRILVH